MKLFKFLINVYFLSVFIINVASAKIKKSSEDLYNELMSAAHEPEKLLPYTEATQLISSLKAKWLAEAPQRKEELRQMIDILETRGSDDDIETANSYRQDLLNESKNPNTTSDEAKTAIRIYLIAYLQTAFIDKYGIASGESTYSGPEGNREISSDLLNTVGRVKNDSRKVLEWAKDKYPEEFMEALSGIELYNSLVSPKETVSQFSEVTIGSRTSFNPTADCYSKEEEKGVTILISAGLLNQKEIVSCDEQKKASPKLFNCFPSGSPFLKTLGNSKKNTNYFFAEGSKENGSEQSELSDNGASTEYETPGHSGESISTSCVFLGGSWSLDKKDSSLITKGSKVQILTPDKKIRTLLADELTSLRKRWQEEKAKQELEQSTNVLLASQKKRCGF